MNCTRRVSIPSVLAVALAAVMAGRSADAAMIPIVNASFEDPILAPGASSFAPGWSFGPESGQTVNPAATFSLSGLPLTVGPAPDGSNVGTTVNFIYGDPSVEEIDVLDQQLTSTLTANTAYTLQVAVGRLSSPLIPQSQLLSGYRVALLAGNTVLAEDVDSMSVAPGAWGTSTVSYTALAGNPLLGQPLRIQLRGHGLALFSAFDDVRLEAVPEPCGLLLAAVAGTCVGWALLRTRQRSQASRVRKVRGQ